MDEADQADTQARGPRRRWLFSGAGALLFLIGVLWLISLPAGSFWDWTGFDGKTAWDLADLLIVPLALAGVAFFLDRRQKTFELQQARADRANEQQIARDREEDATLNLFFDRMSDLLLSHDLRTCDADAEERSLARSRTLTTLQRLSPERKGALLRFLFESRLIDRSNTVIALQGADLREVDLREVDLREVDLRGVSLRGANLAGAGLRGADLRGADLRGAGLRGADLREVYLEMTNLRGAQLQQAQLQRAKLLWAGLRGANLEGANLQRADLRGADLEGAKLRRAKLGAADLAGAKLEEIYLVMTNLRGAYLGEAELGDVYLGEADFVGTNLHGADLGEADLRGVYYTDRTRWPEGFVPPPDAINVDEAPSAAQPGAAPPPVQPSSGVDKVPEVAAPGDG